jgi:hypothetical protein
MMCYHTSCVIASSGVVYSTGSESRTISFDLSFVCFSVVFFSLLLSLLPGSRSHIDSLPWPTRSTRRRELVCLLLPGLPTHLGIGYVTVVCAGLCSGDGLTGPGTRNEWFLCQVPGWKREEVYGMG